jgi:hypothetical protein
MDDISKKIEFQLVLQDAAKYRLLRRIIGDDRDVLLPEQQFAKAGLAPGGSRSGTEGGGAA